MALTTLWSEKYRPDDISTFIFPNNALKQQVERWIEDKNIPHLLFTGIRGTGKTTLAYILLKQLNIPESDVLIINASDENSVDVIRNKITSFAKTFAWDDFKVVLLEEADYITHNGQAVLRRVMEEFSASVRFILTCNYSNRLLPELISRCQTVEFKSPDKIKVTEHLALILVKEKVKFKLDVLDTFVSVYYPDIRKMLNMLEHYSIDGVLQLPETDEVADYKFEIVQCIEKDDWQHIRSIVSENVTDEQWDSLYRFLYENLNKSSKFKDRNKFDQAIVIIAEHLYKNAAVADKEINFIACVIQLGML